MATRQSRCTVSARDTEHLCRFVHGQTAEISQLDDLRFSFVDSCQPPKRPIHRQHIHRRPRTDGSEAGRRNLAIALVGPTSASVVGENPAHLPGAQREEMGSILPVEFLQPGQPHVQLVDERSGLEDVSRPLVTHAAPSRAVELAVNARRQSFECLLVTPLPRVQESGDIELSHGANRGGVGNLPQPMTAFMPSRYRSREGTL